MLFFPTKISLYTTTCHQLVLSLIPKILAKRLNDELQGANGVQAFIESRVLHKLLYYNQNKGCHQSAGTGLFFAASSLKISA